MLPLINGPSTEPTWPLDFIRHGSTAMNDHKGTGDRIRGWIDAPLDDRGREEAKETGQKLCKANPRPAILIPSDLRRSTETAQIISRICGIPAGQPNHALRPWNLAQLQGQESAKVAPIISQLVHQPDQPAPGGGESFRQFEQRFIFGLRGLLARSQGRRLGVIAHHRNERLLAALEKAGWTGEIDFNEFQRKGDPPGILRTFDIPIRWLQHGQLHQHPASRAV